MDLTSAFGSATHSLLWKAFSGHNSTGKWGKVLADVGRQLQVPQCIVVTAMRPDMVLNSECEHVVYCIELTIPFEEAIEEAFESTQDPWRWVLEAL